MLDRVQIDHVNECRVDSHSTSAVTEETISATVNIVLLFSSYINFYTLLKTIKKRKNRKVLYHKNNVIAGLEEIAHGGERTETRRERERVLGLLQRGQRLLERVARRIATPAVVVAVVFAGRGLFKCRS